MTRWENVNESNVLSIQTRHLHDEVALDLTLLRLPSLVARLPPRGPRLPLPLVAGGYRFQS